MRAFSTSAFLMLVIAVAACTPQRAVDVDAARAELRAADSEYSKATSSGNVDAFVALYVTDATMYPPAQDPVQGTDGIRTLADTFFSDPAFAITFTPVTVDVSTSGDLGYTLNIAAITATGPDGEPITERIRDFHLWQKQADGSWKVVVDIWNEEPATPAR